MSKHGTSSSIISYIMFTTLPGSEPDWLLEVYVRSSNNRSSNNRGEPNDDKNVYIINRSGNIDSISPASEIQHTYTAKAAGSEVARDDTDSYRVFHFNGREYYGGLWCNVNACDLDQLVFSNLTDQENSKVLEEIKSAITEVLL